MLRMFASVRAYGQAKTGSGVHGFKQMKGSTGEHEMMETEEIETPRDYDIPEYSLTVCHYHPPSSAGDLSNSSRDKDSLNDFLPHPISG